MAISKVNIAASGDTVFQGFQKYNNTVDKLVTGGTNQNGILSLNLFDGNTLVIPTASVANEVIYGGEYAISSGNSLQVIVQPVTYNCDGVTYSIVTPTTVNITAGDPTLPRIDIIFAEDLSNIEIETGVPSATPVAPLLTNIQTKIGLIYVSPNASASGGTSVVQFVQSYAGTPNNTVRIDADGNLVETDNLTNNGTDLTIKTGATINVNSNTITGNDLTIESNNNLDIFSDTFINVSVNLGFDINQLTVDVNSVNLTASAGDSDININAGGDINQTSTLFEVNSTDINLLSTSSIVLTADTATINVATTFDIIADTLLQDATTEIQLTAPQIQLNGNVWNTAGIKRNIQYVSANYTATTANDIIWSDGGTFTVTLPHASGSTGYQITVSKYDGAGTLTVDALSGNINGVSSVSYSNNTYHSRQFISNGTNWMIESHFV